MPPAIGTMEQAATIEPAASAPAAAGEPRSATIAPVVRSRKTLLLRSRWLILGGFLVAAIGVVSYLGIARRAGPRRLATAPVQREVISRSVVLRGDLEAVDNTDIVCRVKSPVPGSVNATTIRWIVPDGSLVQRGQLLVELDDSTFQEELKIERTALEVARADWVQAEENLKIVQSQNQSDVKTAEVSLKLAELDLHKYLKADYEQTKKEIVGRLSQAETDLQMWQERAAWSQRMVRRGYASTTQGRAEQAKLQSAELAVKRIREELRVLDDFTLQRTKTDLDGKVAEARRARDRIRKQAHAKETLANADRLAKEHVYHERFAQFQDTEEEIRKCHIYAPHDGLAVYFVPEKMRHGVGSQQSAVAQGEPVSEGQKLMRLPELSRMTVHVRAHEVMGTRLRGETWESTGFGECLQAALLMGADPGRRLLGQLAFTEVRPRLKPLEQRRVYDGMPALIKIDALPGRVLQGHIQRVANMAVQESHWVDFRIYHTWIAIDETMEGLRPDMSAEVTILDGGDNEPVMAVPVRAILHSASEGNRGTCFVMTENGPQPREVVVGIQDGERAEIQSGLEEGDEVVLDPRCIP